MSLRAAVAAVLVAGCAAAPAPTSPAPSTADAATLQAASEIMRLEEAWGRALSARDTAFFRRILGDDFVGTGGAELRSKSVVIAELARGAGRMPVPRLEHTQVRLYGDVAVVTGIAAYDAESGVSGSRTRFTEVWVKRGEGWQAVHGHYNAVPAATSP